MEFQLLLFTGLSGSGKSHVLSLLREHYPTIHVGSKLTDRPKRASEFDWEYRFVSDPAAYAGDLAYVSVGNRYAVDAAEIDTAIENGKSYAIACSDLDTIRALIARYRTAVTFVYRRLQRAEFDAIISQRQDSRISENRAQIASRWEEAKNILSLYTSNIGLYSHVIINEGSLDDLDFQVWSLCNHWGLSREAFTGTAGGSPFRG